MTRHVGQSARECRRAKRKLADIASQHAAVGTIARHARAGFVPVERALMLIEAIVEGHAVAHWVARIDGSAAELTLRADPEAPPEILAMLELESVAPIDEQRAGVLG